METKKPTNKLIEKNLGVKRKERKQQTLFPNMLVSLKSVELIFKRIIA
jgi:hypothetical protein